MMAAVLFRFFTSSVHDSWVTHSHCLVDSSDDSKVSEMFAKNLIMPVLVSAACGLI